MVERWGEGTVGKYGYSCVGAVVGATYPEEAKVLRRKASAHLLPRARLRRAGRERGDCSKLLRQKRARRRRQQLARGAVRLSEARRALTTKRRALPASICGRIFKTCWGQYARNNGYHFRERAHRREHLFPDVRDGGGDRGAPRAVLHGGRAEFPPAPSHRRVQGRRASASPCVISSKARVRIPLPENYKQGEKLSVLLPLGQRGFM